ncbi:hypothetical protein C8F01DRAFT_1093437 [Mycena amicta]|nr:hypothetical protein C8F01DRAFT_1093437 [Mycena amicta]
MSAAPTRSTGSCTFIGPSGLCSCYKFRMHSDGGMSTLVYIPPLFGAKCICDHQYFAHKNLFSESDTAPTGVSHTQIPSAPSAAPLVTNPSTSTGLSFNFGAAPTFTPHYDNPPLPTPGPSSTGLVFNYGTTHGPHSASGSNPFQRATHSILSPLARAFSGPGVLARPIGQFLPPIPDQGTSQQVREASTKRHFPKSSAAEMQLVNGCFRDLLACDASAHGAIFGHCRHVFFTHDLCRLGSITWTAKFLHTSSTPTPNFAFSFRSWNLLAFSSRMTTTVPSSTALYGQFNQAIQTQLVAHNILPPSEWVVIGVNSAWKAASRNFKAHPKLVHSAFTHGALENIAEDHIGRRIIFLAPATNAHSSSDLLCLSTGSFGLVSDQGSPHTLTLLWCLRTVRTHRTLPTTTYNDSTQHHRCFVGLRQVQGSKLTSEAWQGQRVITQAKLQPWVVNTAWSRSQLLNAVMEMMEEQSVPDNSIWCTVGSRVKRGSLQYLNYFNPPSIPRDMNY